MGGGGGVSPGVWPRDEPLDERLLVVEVEALRVRDSRVRELPLWLGAGDLLVLNDAATLPASFRARVGGETAEVRLLARVADDRTWRAVTFDGRDWRTRTEDRSAPPQAGPGTRVIFAEDLHADVTEVDPVSPRLLTIRFAQAGAALWSAIYRHGLPVQYAHVAAPLALWATQTPFASRPWAVEQPSAGRPLAWRLLTSAREAGVEIAWLTHAAGLSSTGDAALDAALPLAERFDIPAATVAAVAAARRRGRRVVAAGTTVVRALEGCAVEHDGALVAGEGTTDLRVGPAHRLRVVDALLTGMHDPGTSHFELLRAFAPTTLLERAHAHAESAGYLGHEFGDSALILRAA
jgi:S-adenosylmethionine:tRNA ribosyltransferase-isomerase